MMKIENNWKKWKGHAAIKFEKFKIKIKKRQTHKDLSKIHTTSKWWKLKITEKKWKGHAAIKFKKFKKFKNIFKI